MLFQEIKKEKFGQRMFISFLLLRTSVFSSALIIFEKRHPLFQVISIVVQNFMVVVYLVVYRPIHHKIEMTFQIVYDVIVFVASVLVLALVMLSRSRNYDYDKASKIGVAFIACNITIIAADVFLVLIDVIKIAKHLYRQWKGYINKNKEAKKCATPSLLLSGKKLESLSRVLATSRSHPKLMSLTSNRKRAKVSALSLENLSNDQQEFINELPKIKTECLEIHPLKSKKKPKSSLCTLISDKNTTTSNSSELNSPRDSNLEDPLAKNLNSQQPVLEAQDTSNSSSSIDSPSFLKSASKIRMLSRLAFSNNIYIRSTLSPKSSVLSPPRTLSGENNTFWSHFNANTLKQVYTLEKGKGQVQEFGMNLLEMRRKRNRLMNTLDTKFIFDSSEVKINTDPNTEAEAFTLESFNGKYYDNHS